MKVRILFLAGAAVTGVGLLLAALMFPVVSYVIGKAEAVAYERYYARIHETQTRLSSSAAIGSRDVSVIVAPVHRLRQRQSDRQARQRSEESRKQRQDWFKKNAGVLAAHIRTRSAALHRNAVSYIRSIAPAGRIVREQELAGGSDPWSVTRLSMATLFGRPPR